MNKCTYDRIIIQLLKKFLENKCQKEELQTLLHYLKYSTDYKMFDLHSEFVWKNIDSVPVYHTDAAIRRLKEEARSILLKGREKKIIHMNEKKSRLSGFKYAAAAILLFIISMGCYFLWSGKQQVEFKELIAGHGQIVEHTLPDGTHVTLNSQSKIIIPSDFGVKRRELEMAGEVFFDVTSDQEKQFIIKNDNLIVRVLGTSFNIKSYAEDDIIKVTVSTGKVQVNITDMGLQLPVFPNEHFIANKLTGDISKSTFTVNNHLVWRQGAIYFEKEPIREVIKTINRKYDKTIELNCTNCRHIISGMHGNESLEDILESICFITKLKYVEEGDKIILYE